MTGTRPRSVPVITLTTDFGSKDGFVGIMKGVIWGICPRAQIADISHEIGPQNVLEGAVALWRAYPFFPAGTVHVAVVDPGVGTERRALAIRAGAWYFVGPDNGLFTPVLEDAEARGWPSEVVQLTDPRYWLPDVSQTFHGRDIFAPAGAHLACGVPLRNLGQVVRDPFRLALPRPEKTAGGWRAHVLGQDSFGNLTTDLHVELIRQPERARVCIGSFEIAGVVHAYGVRPPGELVALADSQGRLEIAVVDGSAAQMTGAKVGDELQVVE
jgi:S-adenosylmethionine hydrolase